MKRSKSHQLAYTGLMTALIFIGTKLINIPTLRGYIHLGDSMIFISAFLLSWKYTALASGLGSALADLLSPYAIYTLPTFIIKSLMGIIVRITYKAKRKSFFLLCLLVSLFWFIINLLFSYLMTLKVNENPEIYIDVLKSKGVETAQQVLNYTEGLRLLFQLSAFLFPLFIVLVFFIISKKSKQPKILKHLIGFTFAGMWMVLGYYVVETILYGNPIIPIFGIPFNSFQFIIGIIIAELVIVPLNNKLSMR